MASRWLSAEGSPKKNQEIRYEGDLRYFRQGYELHVPVDLAKLQKQGFGPLGDEFHKTHHRFYKFDLDAPVEIVNLRAVGVGHIKRIKLARKRKGPKDPRKAVTESHKIWFEGRQVKTLIYDRALLRPGHVVKGPAIITETDSTTVILPGHRGEVDQFYNILIWPGR